MALSKQPYKGARDFYPADKRVQKYLFSVWRTVCERFGYEEYDAPILEPLEIYLAKTGEEIVNEQTYTFEDRGGRNVVVRPEMTPTVSRLVAARRQELAYPLRWYSIPNLWRYERPQRGRLREHWQLNVDLFGVAGIEAELEMITLVDAIFKAFGADEGMYEIRLNSRQLMDIALRQYLHLTESEAHDIRRLIDRMHKLDHDKFIAMADGICSPKARQTGVVERLLSLLSAGSLDELPQELQAHDSVNELNKMIRLLKQAGISNVKFDVSLMRGFDYYTDIVFEVFDKHPDNNRSMLGGGRYDGLVGLFGVNPIPTVGFGWGDVTLANFLELHHLLPKLTPETDIYVVLAGDVGTKIQKPVDELRQAGLNVAVDLSGRKLGDQLKAAAKKEIPFALVIGEEELAEQKFTLRNLKEHSESKHDLKRITEIVKQAHDGD